MRKTRGGWGETGLPFLAATAPFPKSRACYFRFARFNTSALYYLRAWHRLYHGETLNYETLLATVRVKTLKEDGYFYRDELSA